MIKIDHKCHYPFNPSSIVTILLFKKDGLAYIAADGEERCAWHFAKEIETTIRNSIIIPNNTTGININKEYITKYQIPSLCATRELKPKTK